MHFIKKFLFQLKKGEAREMEIKLEGIYGIKFY